MGHCLLRKFYCKKEGAWETVTRCELDRSKYLIIWIPVTLGLFYYGNSGIAVGELFSQAVFLTIMCWIAYIDYRHHIIPNKLLVILVGCRMAVLVIFALFLSTESRPIIEGSLRGAFIMGCIALFVFSLSRGAIGAGDVKMLAVMGLFFGFKSTLIMLMDALILGGLIGISMIWLSHQQKGSALPFATFLYFATFISRCVGRG